jgi:hypothetical protein
MTKAPAVPTAVHFVREGEDDRMAECPDLSGKGAKILIGLARSDRG